MYTRLTKVINLNGRECVTCIYYGTEMCRIHNEVPDCGHCNVLAAILNQLYVFENIVGEMQDINT